MSEDGTPGNAEPGTAELQLGNRGDADHNREGPGNAELQLGISGDEGNKPGWHSRGYLPHCDADGLIQHITFHLADSLPKSALDHLERSLAEMPEDERGFDIEGRGIRRCWTPGTEAACCANLGRQRSWKAPCFTLTVNDIDSWRG